MHAAKFTFAERGKTMSRTIDVCSCKKSPLFRLLFTASLFLFVSVPDSVLAQDLSRLSIEELLNLDITSASRKPEKVSQTAAAVHVITAEDIRRSGVTTIWDALRLAPGVHVGRASSARPSVSVRGLGSLAAGRLLILQDGRTLYDPLFSGTEWSVQDILLDNVKQIEVIRGPGGTMWGANAAQGVINIVTKNAADTVGTLLQAGGGSHEHVFGGGRHGGEIGEDTFYRVWAKAFDRGDYDTIEGGSAEDDWWGTRFGFRVDSELTDEDTLEVSGDAIYAEQNFLSPFNPIGDDFLGFEPGQKLERENVGGNLLGRWTHDLGVNSDLQLQAYYEHADSETDLLEFHRDTFDLDFQHRVPFGEIHDVVWGLGYRVTSDDFEDRETFSLNPSSDTFNLFSAFVQDEIDIVEDTFSVIVGSKVEHNDFTGFEFSPNVRAAWTPTTTETVWAAVSRAVRTPGRTDEDVDLIASVLNPSPETGGLPVVVRLIGSDDIDVESLIAYEVGFRSMVNEDLSVDVAGYFIDYDDFFSFERQDDQAEIILDDGFPRVEAPTIIDNNLSSNLFGGEILLDYRPTEDWRLTGSYNLVFINVYGSDTTDKCDGSPGTTRGVCNAEDNAPEQIVSLTSSYDLTETIEVDLFFQWVKDFLSAGGEIPIDDYFILDARVAWEAVPGVELAVVGQNLIEDEHVEWIERGPGGETPSAVPRGVFGKLTWTFN